MKIKVADTTPRQIDYLVAKCEGYEAGLAMQQDFHTDQLVPVEPRHMISIPEGWNCSYSTNWVLGGAIIEREGIELNHWDWFNEGWWVAKHKEYQSDVGTNAYGPTPLVAAMRCFVASRLGDEVEIPEDLV